MVTTNFGENIDAGRPTKTQAQLAEERAYALRYLLRTGAHDLIDMLGVAR